MTKPAKGIHLLKPDGSESRNDSTAELWAIIDGLHESVLQRFYREMAVIRAFDIEAANLQRQGEMALWVPSLGQEAAQVGSGLAVRPQDHIFPAYREHAVARIRGVEPIHIIRMLRGLTHGGWNPAENGNFHLYTLVIGSQTLHATGYAMGIKLDAEPTGNPEQDPAVITYFGDGAMSQGDVSEAFTFASSFQTPQVFFLQNNHWAISVPVSVQSRVPLYERGLGFGIPSQAIDGNDVLVSYAVTLTELDAARSGQGPRLIEALTYRIGAHTSSDDPSRYRSEDEVENWRKLDPIARYETWLRSRGATDAFFAEVKEEADALAADTRRLTLSLPDPAPESMFENVYSEPHPVTAAQAKWLADYEASFGGAE